MSVLLTEDMEETMLWPWVYENVAGRRGDRGLGREGLLFLVRIGG